MEIRKRSYLFDFYRLASPGGLPSRLPEATNDDAHELEHVYHLLKNKYVTTPEQVGRLIFKSAGIHSFRTQNAIASSSSLEICASITLLEHPVFITFKIL